MDSHSVISKELEHFDKNSGDWWDPKGKFRSLHKLNPTRLDYINTQICIEFDREMDTQSPFKGLTVLDVGCGGGLLTEPMIRLGAEVFGVDAAEMCIEAAKQHSKEMNLDIHYEQISVEELSKRGEKFHIILCSEVLEHVNNPAAFLEPCRNLLQPNGIMIASTINRNLKSYFLAILGAEYLFHWLPIGTHSWKSFIRPEEMQRWMEAVGLTWLDTKGLVYNPIQDRWHISPDDFDINYISTFVLQDSI